MDMVSVLILNKLATKKRTLQQKSQTHECLPIMAVNCGGKIVPVALLTILKHLVLS